MASEPTRKREPRIRRRLREAIAQDLTYPDIGATLTNRLPTGYRRISAEMSMGIGEHAFRKAREGLSTWKAHRDSGVIIYPSVAPIMVSVNVLAILHFAGLRLALPCRIVDVIDETRRYGFAYGTLKGHAESGEERFEVHWRDDDEVVFTVSAFSKPDRWYSIAAGPLARRLQDRATNGYLDALKKYVSQS
jgi:uncharacterized protein (UPF0548 family)